MSLITCPDCHRQVSAAAPACPHCGRPLQAMANPYATRALSPRVADARRNVQIAYGLWAGSYVFGPVLLAALIFAYVKRGEARGTFLAGHYDWLIDTFWLSLLLAFGAIVACIVLMVISEGLALIGMIAAVLAVLGWPLYRLIRGFVALTNGRDPESSA